MIQGTEAIRCKLKKRKMEAESVHKIIKLADLGLEGYLLKASSQQHRIGGPSNT